MVSGPLQHWRFRRQSFLDLPILPHDARPGQVHGGVGGHDLDAAQGRDDVLVWNWRTLALDDANA